jgi:hypothetical protein
MIRNMSQLSNGRVEQKIRTEYEKSGLLEEDRVEEDDGSSIEKPSKLSRERFTPESEDIVVVQNVQKTYLLGIEGVAALRCVAAVQ